MTLTKLPLIALALAALIVLVGCETPPATTAAAVVTPATKPPAPPAPPVAPADPLAGLRTFTIADLKAASADAWKQSPPDETAGQCYDWLITNLPLLQAPQAGQAFGAFYAFQKTRDIANGLPTSQGNTLKSLNLACAALMVDTQTTINRLALIGAGTAATAGAAAPLLQALPALVP